MKISMVLNFIILVLVYSASVNRVESRKLDETTVLPTNGTAEEKCVPCGYTYPPPPANPPPSPPPPPPPSPKKPPPQIYCPPPPSYIYITGPPDPGNLYPVDQGFSGESYHHHRGFATFLLPLLVILLTLLAF